VGEEYSVKKNGSRRRHLELVSVDFGGIPKHQIAAILDLFGLRIVRFVMK
jgi:hypothetical protein